MSWISFSFPLNQQFYEALMTGNIESMQRALDEGGDVDAIDDDGFPLLYDLILSRNETGVKFILEHGANVNVNYITHQENIANIEITPLHYAAASGNPNLVKLLLEHGADINVNKELSSDYSWTPLSYAIISGNIPNKNKLEIVKILLKHGADLNIKLKKDESMAIHHAAEYGAIDVMKFLLKHKTSSSSSSSSGSKSSSLVKKAIDINVQDKLKRTPIDFAYTGKRKKMAVFLLSKGSLLPDYGRTKARSVPFVIQALLEEDVTLNTYRRVYQQLEDKKLEELAGNLKAEIDEKEKGTLIPILRQRKIEEIKEEDKDKPHISELPNDVLQTILSKANLLDPIKKSKKKINNSQV